MTGCLGGPTLGSKTICSTSLFTDSRTWLPHTRKALLAWCAKTPQAPSLSSVAMTPVRSDPPYANSFIARTSRSHAPTALLQSQARTLLPALSSGTMSSLTSRQRKSWVAGLLLSSPRQQSRQIGDEATMTSLVLGNWQAPKQEMRMSSPENFRGRSSTSPRTCLCRNDLSKRSCLPRPVLLARHL